jgi:transposase
LVYQDEVHFQIQTTVTCGWFKKGSAPTVKSFPGRFKASYSGFVIPETGELFVATPETFNYETTISSIRKFLTAKPLPEGKHYVLIMDNAPWHKKTLRLVDTEKQTDYADISSKVSFLMLPPYSPDLNPIEQVWRITRKENTHNTFFPTLSALKETVDNAFKEWETPNNQLKSLCSFK